MRTKFVQKNYKKSVSPTSVLGFFTALIHIVASTTSMGQALTKPFGAGVEEAKRRRLDASGEAPAAPQA
jgi:hypothetical protein